MTNKQFDKLQKLDVSNVLLKAVNNHTAKVFDAWLRQNHAGEVFDGKQLESMGDIGKTVVRYKGRIALIRIAEDLLHYTYISSIFGDKITE
ncbi:MAG: hypothetical protein ACTTIA_02415 [Candidatus Cryptobacteroides sp.]